jgi:hypothetical protein
MAAAMPRPGRAGRRNCAPWPSAPPAGPQETDEVYVLIGDMNIEARDDAIMASLTDQGFTVPFFGPTNLGGTKHYDQIAFTGNHQKTNFLQAGRIDWRGAVFGAADKDHYEAIVQAARATPYADWDVSYQAHFASFEMSDHLPIWVELRTDYSDGYLRRFAPG